MPASRASAAIAPRRCAGSCSSACSKTPASPSTTSTASSTPTHVAEWKAIAARRLEVLDEQIARLNQARAYLAGALLCRYDHPATDCKIMGAEIDRRLAEPVPPG